MGREPRGAEWRLFKRGGSVLNPGVSLTRPRPLRLDGRFFKRGGERVFIKAVTFGPFPPGEFLDPAEEFPRIAAAGFNTLRVYEAPDRHLLDTAAAHGLMVMAGLPWEWSRDFIHQSRFRAEAELRYVEFLEEHGRHPALAAVLVANEVPPDLVRWLGPAEVRDVLEGLIDTCRAEAPHLLVAYASFPTTEYLEPRNADFTAFNLYLEEREALGRYLRRLQNIAGDRPVLITEFGLDTIRHTEREQAEILSWHLRECLEAGVAGTTFYAWSDRWINRGRRVDDWAFGLTRQDRSAKPALAVLEKSLPAIGAHRDALAPVASPPRKISVVICTHNGGSRLASCLPACLGIDYPDYEVIVIDDGSTDGTSSIVGGFPQVRYIHQDHAGLSVARNCGAEAASGEIIAYTDDDCEPDHDWLYWLARCFDDPRVGAAGGPNLPPPARNLQEAVIAAAPGAPSHVLFNDTRAEHLPGCNLAIRREALQRVRGFREQYVAAGDDVDICWRLADAGWELAFAPPAFVWHRRRTSFFRYLKQQGGYGRAEAILFGDHPNRFAPGGIRWEGALYAGGPVSADAHSVIYHGPMGSAPFQNIAFHVMPRRQIAECFDNARARGLLHLADWLAPRLRALARWVFGGPFPQFRPPRQTRHVFGDDFRSQGDWSFASGDPEARLHFLSRLQALGWRPLPGTEPWDLELKPCVLLSALEVHGDDFFVLRVRTLHPPGHRGELDRQLESAALAAGLSVQI
jgi:GT2 family glycosyltransferase